MKFDILIYVIPGYYYTVYLIDTEKINLESLNSGNSFKNFSIWVF